MRLYRQDEVTEDNQGVLCRQSRSAGVVRLIVWCVVLAIPPFFGWKLSKPWLIWVFAPLAAILILMALRDLAVMFRSTNWLLRISSDGLWINLLSYRDRNVDPDVRSVVRLDYPEIASVARHTEVYATPSELTTGPGSYGKVGGSTGWRDEFLEIQLNHDRTGDLKTALIDLRFPSAPAEPSQQARVRVRVSPVWLVSPAVIRIAWVSAHGPAVLPRIGTALAHFEGRASVAEPTHRERPDWRKMNADQVQDLARELVDVHGATMEATALLVRAGGIKYGEACAQIQQFEQAGSLPEPITPR